ncbi:monosaccharide ABC transporter membrane protein (CUT2 family) [Panacagrimonas perspica]|uniref:Monosaccharide ABC transporter membrane protein (CUT2 family) n=1 Tax=Panacagrimonas perspica TaxID=381431 RepID=A0A4S3K1H6_9GAMM|nr:ABC transporter permease [Panacagrimonas perspica]TDU31052.1 monosaccharide ABC transporter membrane protein (CUT2 family) [Panacagrimonas perspica]THD01805.1 ABC transporter permease [Panacagrimonas perspica]
MTDTTATPDTTGKGGGRRRLVISQEQIVLIVTALLAIGFALTLSGFATIGNLLALTRSVAILGILGIAMSVVVIGRGLDLSLVATMAVSSAFALQLMQHGWGWPGAAAAGMGVAIAIGLINGFIIAFVEVPALFTTLATGFLIFGLGRTFLLDGVITYLPPQAETFAWIGQGQLLGIPAPVIVLAIVALFVQVLLSRMTVGRFVYAHGDNVDAARLTGIAVRPLTMLEYAICAAIGCLAGLVMAASTASINMQIVNSTLIFDVILVVVLGGVSLVGGRGGVLSVLAGTALIGTLLNGMTIMDLDNNIQNIVKGAVLLAAIIVDNRLHPQDEETARQGD